MTALSNLIFEELLNGQAFSRHHDVKIVLDMDPTKEEYNLHKTILALHSPFFRKMFFNEPTKNVFEVGGISKQDFDVVIAAMYGRVHLLSATNTLLQTLRYLGCDKIIANRQKMIKNVAENILAIE